MNPEIKKKWLEALRSGTYEQGKGWLRTQDNSTKTDQFCCLGVLCDLHQQAVETGWDIPRIVGGGTSKWSYGYIGFDTSLPSSVQSWAEIGPSSPIVSNPLTGLFISLAYLNDSGSTFSEIADIIEENL